METMNKWRPPRACTGTSAIKYLPWCHRHGVRYTLSKFADDTKLSGALLCWREGTVKKDLEKLEKRPSVNPINFSKAECKTLQLDVRAITGSSVG